MRRIPSLCHILFFLVLVSGNFSVADLIAKDYRHFTSDEAARNFETFLTSKMVKDGVESFRVEHLVPVNDSSNLALTSTVSDIDSPEQFISLVNNLPDMDVRLEVKGFKSGVVYNIWVVYFSKKASDVVSSSDFYKDYSNETYDVAKTGFVNDVLGSYQGTNTVDHYNLSYQDPTTSEVINVLFGENTDLIEIMDRLDAGDYEMVVDVVDSSGTMARRKFAFQKDSSDIAPKEVQLVWTVPTVRENGDILQATDIVNYEIYYSVIASDGTITDKTIVVDGRSTSKKMEELPSGEIHFAIVAVDSDGLKSAMSKLVSVSIN